MHTLRQVNHLSECLNLDQYFVQATPAYLCKIIKMQIAQQLQDRRGMALHHDKHWTLMSVEQKISLYNLHRYGYRLLFVRHLPTGPLAVVSQNDQLSTIDRNGQEDPSPNIHLRD